MSSVIQCIPKKILKKQSQKNIYYFPEGEVGVIPPVEGVEGGVANEGVEPPASCSRGSGVVGTEESLWQT